MTLFARVSGGYGTVVWLIGVFVTFVCIYRCSELDELFGLLLLTTTKLLKLMYRFCFKSRLSIQLMLKEQRLTNATKIKEKRQQSQTVYRSFDTNNID